MRRRSDTSTVCATGTSGSNELSSEMFALALDVTALGSAHLVSTMGLMLNDVSPAAQANVVPLRAGGAVAVHLAARRIHGLDIADR